MNVKLIAVDLDNTLLHRDKSISEYTRSIFERCRERGIRTAFATARTLWNTESFQTGNFFEIIRPDAAVTTGGAFVSVGGETLREFAIPDTIRTPALAELAANPMVIKLSARGRNIRYATTPYSDDTKTIVTDFSESVPEPIFHFSFRSNDENVAISLAAQYPNLHIHRVSGDNLYDIGLKSADKLGGVRILAEHFDIPLSEVAAFGDDFSDIEMLRACGYGVAMENAIEECKLAAGYICADCDKDGVAAWIEENILN